MVIIQLYYPRRVTRLPEGVDDLFVRKLDASRVSGLVVHVEPEHLPVDQVNLRRVLIRESGREDERRKPQLLLSTLF